MADGDIATVAVAFARRLRDAGLDIPLDRATTFAEAVAAVGTDQRSPVYWAGRATLLRRPEDAAIYDRWFAAFFDGDDAAALAAAAASASAADEPEPVPVTLATDHETLADDARPSGDDGPFLTLRHSAHEVLRHKDFASLSPAELDEARRLMADARLAGSLRRSRRRRPSRRGRGRPDVRRTLRGAVRRGGDVVAWAATEHDLRPRRIVLLCDVSGSMEPYSRALLRFLQAAVSGPGRIEAFTLGTRLTRVTRELSSRDPESALRRVARAVPDWDGGTRLGDGLREFNDRWGVRGLARGAVVVVLSDGWDRGDPNAVAEQMARLRRVAHEIVWVNPLKVTPGYAPLARGMAAALPYVDHFVEGHSLASLESLAAIIEGRRQ